MKERPIPYSPEMVRARRAGLKTQTRRSVKWKGVDSGLNLMCRWMSRGLDEVISVRAERLTSICFADAEAEGVSDWVHHPKCSTAQDGYRLLWESINGPGSWNRAQWVFAVEFKVLEGAA